MLKLFKNHNMMMPVDFGDNPYTIKAMELSPGSPDSSDSSKWDWNKLFVPMQQAMNGMINNKDNNRETEPSTKYVSPFKYASPFKKVNNNNNNNNNEKNTALSALNPNAVSFKFEGPKPAQLNPNAVSFKFEGGKICEPDESGESKECEQNKPVLTMTDKKEKDGKKRAFRRITKKKKKNMLKHPDYNNDDTILAMHGFKKIKKIKNSLQGEIYIGETIRGHDIVKQLKIPKSKKRRVVIKKTVKSLHKKRISIQDGMNIVVDENVVKEAIILHHLTVDNNPAGSSICKLLSFFESADAYYIVTEYGGNQTLKQFVDRAHEYIKKGKLNPAHWKKISKYIGWQIVATIYWMHNDMNCAHLDLKLENIMINNGNFIVNETDGTVTIDRNLTCKIIDFGLTEIFKTDDDKKNEYFPFDVDQGILGTFHINNKYGNLQQHQSPEIFNESVYDARKSDIWGLGVILFYMAFGIYPYSKQISSDTGFWSCKHKKIDLFLDMNHLSHLANNKLISLLNGCLDYEESERFDVSQIVTNLWFKTYFKKYAEKIKEQSQAQKKKNIDEKQKTDATIPYYKPQKIMH